MRPPLSPPVAPSQPPLPQGIVLVSAAIEKGIYGVGLRLLQGCGSGGGCSSPLRLDDFDWVFIHPPALAGVLDHWARAEDLESLVELVLGVVSFAIVVDVD